MNYKEIILLFLAVKIILFVFIFTFHPYLPFSKKDFDTNSDHFNGQQQSQFEFQLSPYDGPQYLRIAYYGYGEVFRTDKKIFSWFPLYPALMKVFSYLTFGDLTLAGILISLISSFWGIFYLYKLVRLDFDHRISENTIFYFLIFPTAIFSIAVYTESLFFLLSVLAVYAARKRYWWSSGLCGFFAALTRSPGILLCVPLLIEYIGYVRELKPAAFADFFKKTKADSLFILLIPMGILAFFTYTYTITGDFFFHFKAQALWGRENPSLMKFWLLLTDRIQHFGDLPLHGFFHSKMDFIASMLFLLASFFMIKKIRLSYLLYGVCAVCLPLLSGQTMSMMRYISVSFPHFIFFGYLGGQYRIFHLSVTLIFALLLSLFSLLFINWYWVA